jgi:hypothetical protein
MNPTSRSNLRTHALEHSNEGDGEMTASKNQGTALVTGASSGIGTLYADRLARRGYDLILVARNRERLEALAQRLTREAGRTVDLVVADLHDRKDLGRVEAVLRSDARITLLVNNAGVGSTAPLLHADIDKMEALIALNITALTRLTYAAVPPSSRAVGARSSTLLPSSAWRPNS